jgi:signal transduction histidine kinase
MKENNNNDDVGDNLTGLNGDALALEQAKKELKNALTQVTELEQQLIAKKNAEKLQKALFEISSLKNENLELKQLYPHIHQIIDKLINAKNFFILLFDEDTSEITFPYFVDEKENKSPVGLTLPLGEGVSSYVIKTRKPQHLTPKKAQHLIKQGEIKEQLGDQSYVSWLGAPMISADIIHGIIVVQSYHESVIFTDDDLNILELVANHVASAIEITINTQQRRESQIKLAKNHRLLEQQNQQLSSTLKALKKTQQELIQKEKMASLGGLVAGIAHEINTPLGICVTGVSHLLEECKIFRAVFEDKQLTEAKLVDFLDDVDEVNKILTSNMQRASDLIHSFKQIAVDQSSNEIRHFNVKGYLDEIILSLRPRLKRTAHQLIINCNESISICSHAGALSQILSNLIINAITHAFEEGTKGIITIDVSETKSTILLVFSDDGLGLSKDDMKQLFDPFFTTKRGEGGSGLGTHLIFNLVTTSLKGKVKAASKLGEGLTYQIEFPKNLSE